MFRRRLASIVLAAALPSAGCAPTMYTLAILDATQAVEEARQAGAPSSAPYEFYFAQANLDNAREEAGEAQYQHALESAGQAREYGIRARDLARRRGRESGR